MLQSLLAERFKLAIHRENKEQPVFALVEGKNGQKLQAAAADYIRPAAKHTPMPTEMWPSPAELSVRCAAVEDPTEP